MKASLIAQLNAMAKTLPGGVDPSPGPVTKIDWREQPLGLEPDAVLAERLDCPIDYVRAARQRRGIPAVKP